jgi:hypothetical protein
VTGPEFLQLPLARVMVHHSLRWDMITALALLKQLIKTPKWNVIIQPPFCCSRPCCSAWPVLLLILFISSVFRLLVTANIVPVRRFLSLL